MTMVRPHRSFGWLLLSLGCAGACGDDREARIAALEARIATLEQRTAETTKAIEPLATLPEDVAAQQSWMKSVRAEQSTLVARIARVEQELDALPKSGAIGVAPPTTTPLPNTFAIGIPECDEFMRKYVACIEDKVPEAARKSMMEGVEAMSKAWRDAAAGPMGAEIAKACTAAAEAAASATAAMGCVW